MPGTISWPRCSPRCGRWSCRCITATPSRKAWWSHRDPVSLFGADLSGTGWVGVAAIFDRLATMFTACTFYDFEVVGADAGADVAYLGGLERSTVTFNGDSSSPTIRSTTVFRREDGVWRPVHRHGDRVAVRP